MGCCVISNESFAMNEIIVKMKKCLGKQYLKANMMHFVGPILEQNQSP